jgi:hypothetical protein
MRKVESVNEFDVIFIKDWHKECKPLRINLMHIEQYVNKSDRVLIYAKNVNYCASIQCI